MKNKILLIYDFEKLFDVLSEIEKEIKFKIIKLTKTDLNNFTFDNDLDYLLLSKKELNNFKRQIVLDKLPIKFLKLLEKINIGFLKQNFNEMSDIKVGRYIIDTNSREMRHENKLLKLTEKECEVIIYLSKSNQIISIENLQLNVWGHQSKLETHTVETHIYRLRKKILENFKDNDFITSEKNGYKIK